MVCPACGLENDPSSATCLRCNTPLIIGNQPAGAAPAPPPPYQSAYGPPPAFGPRPAPRRSQAWIIAGIAVAVILLALAGVGLVAHNRNRGGSPPAGARQAIVGSAASASSAQEQGATFDKVLDASVRTRKKLNSSINKVQQCTQLNQAVSDLRATVSERQTQVRTVEAAAVDKLPDGERLRSTLQQALEYAREADLNYLDWASKAPADGCSAVRQASFDQGQAASGKSGAAKTTFLKLWNPVAAELGLPHRTRDDI